MEYRELKEERERDPLEGYSSPVMWSRNYEGLNQDSNGMVRDIEEAQK